MGSGHGPSSDSTRSDPSNLGERGACGPVQLTVDLCMSLLSDSIDYRSVSHLWLLDTGQSAGLPEYSSKLYSYNHGSLQLGTNSRSRPS